MGQNEKPIRKIEDDKVNKGELDYGIEPIESEEELDDLLDSIFRVSTVGMENVQTAEGAFEHSAATAEPDELEELGFYEPQIEEILKGKEDGVDVRGYANGKYNWKQMHEIRLGLTDGLNVGLYENEKFNAEQMKEIRLGLKDALDVTKYASLMNSAEEMRQIRLQMASEVYEKVGGGAEKKIHDDLTGLDFFISEDFMTVYMFVPSELKRNYTNSEIEAALRRMNVVDGYVEEGIGLINNILMCEKRVAVAKGHPAEDGRNGYYEFFFDTDDGVKPTTNPDGTINYSNYIQGSVVKKGQILAQYHPAGKGKPGRTVNGIPIKAVAGRDLNTLKLNGVLYNASTKRFVSTENGNAHYSKETNTLRVSSCLVIENKANYYNRNIEYNGDVMVNGDVEDNAMISATGNIIVNGFVGKCVLNAGQDIVAKGGVNGQDTVLKAGGNVQGFFFENVNILSGGDVSGNYFIHCDVKAFGDVIATGGNSRIIGGSVQAAGNVKSTMYLLSSTDRMVISAGEADWLKAIENNNIKKMETIEKEIIQLEEIKKNLVLGLPMQELVENAQFQETSKLLKEKNQLYEDLTYRVEHMQEIANRSKDSMIQVLGEMEAGIMVSVGGMKIVLVEKQYGHIKKDDMQKLLKQYLLKNKDALLKKGKS